MKRVCYFTSKLSSDVRVFEKECVSLVKAGYEVYLVSPNAKSGISKGVNIVGVPYYRKGLLSRLLLLPKILFNVALEIDADIYHFNDPTSLRYCAKLKKLGKKIVFDSFEDHPTLIFEKRNLPKFLKWTISKIYSLYEYEMAKKLDGLILCYHWTKERLDSACKNNCLVYNFPILKTEEVASIKTNNRTLCYAGSLSSMWNIKNIVQSLDNIPNVRLILAGHGDEAYLNDVKRLKAWSKVDFLGTINHSDVPNRVYSNSNIAIAILDYIPLTKGNTGNLSNNKLFEYMMSGLPVICTDFLMWKEIVEKNNTGICVNPKQTDEIEQAIIFLLANPETAIQMGENGRKIVESRYNWGVEEQKLLDLYNSL